VAPLASRIRRRAAIHCRRSVFIAASVLAVASSPLVMGAETQPDAATPAKPEHRAAPAPAHREAPKKDKKDKDHEDGAPLWLNGYWAGYAAGQAGRPEFPIFHPAWEEYSKKEKERDNRDRRAEWYQYDVAYQEGYAAGLARAQLAQAPTSPWGSSLASVCGNELVRYCQGVPADGRKQRACLSQFLTLLSAVCRQGLAKSN